MFTIIWFIPGLPRMTSCVRAAKPLVRLYRSSGLSKPWLLVIGISSKITVVSCLNPFNFLQVYNYIKGWYPSSFYLPPKLQKVLTDMPHPGGGCFMAILWLHPCMTFDRMILATVLTAYLWCGYGVTEGDYVYMKSYTTSKYSRKVHREKAIYYHERWRAADFLDQTGF